MGSGDGLVVDTGTSKKIENSPIETSGYESKVKIYFVYCWKIGTFNFIKNKIVENDATGNIKKYKKLFRELVEEENSNNSRGGTPVEVVTIMKERSIMKTIGAVLDGVIGVGKGKELGIGINKETKFSMKKRLGQKTITPLIIRRA